MLDRLTTSRHFQTFLGAFALALGVFLAACLLVGVAVVFDAIVGVTS